jgi:protein SCO1/2
MTPTAPPSHRAFVWLILIAALAAAAGLWLGGRLSSGASAPALDSAVLYPQPRPVREFRLDQSSGRPLTVADWQGHWNVVYFGYSSCPDVCPTTLATFKAAAKVLAERGLADRVRFDFISVDPQRDTPEKLGPYVAYFNTDFIAATGTDEQLTTLTRALGILYSRRIGSDGLVEVDHSGSAVIVDPQARVVGIFRPPLAAAALAKDLSTLIAAPGT